MNTHIKSTSLTVVVATAFLALATMPAQAIPITAYAHFPSGNPDNNFPGGKANWESHVFGPAIADDFMVTDSGDLHEVTWWGSHADPGWILSLYENDTSKPNNATRVAVGGAATTVRNLGPELYEYTFLWNIATTLERGVDYWLSITNTNTDWSWAAGTGHDPHIGTEKFDSKVSATGVVGSWETLSTDHNMAFAIKVPEPSTLLLLGSGVIGLGLARRKKSRLNTESWIQAIGRPPAIQTPQF